MKLRHGTSNIHEKAAGWQARPYAVILAAAAFTTAPILTEAIISPAMAQTTAQGTAQKAQKGAYDPKTDPFAQDDRLAAISSGLTGDAMEKITKLFNALGVGGTEGVKTVKSDGRPPRVAAEALARGGDCTDFAYLTISILREHGIPGGAMVVHFNSSREGIDHMVPYVEVGGGRQIIIDLQAQTLGKTGKGEYAVLTQYTYGQAAAMYHCEYGDYLRDQGRATEAMAAYERSLEIYPDDAHVHQNLGVLCEKAGEMERAAEHFKRAAALDKTSSRERDVTRGTYNEELQAGLDGYNGADWCGCARHFQNALESGEKLTTQERASIGQYRDACSGKCEK